MEAVPLKNEITVINNRQESGIDILDDTLRVMLADREPRWETRYLLNLLKRDQRMEFRSLLFRTGSFRGFGISRASGLSFSDRRVGAISGGAPGDVSTRSS